MCKLSISKLRTASYTEFEAQVLNYVAENVNSLHAGDEFKGVPGHQRYGVSEQVMRINDVTPDSCSVLWVSKNKNLAITFADYASGRGATTTTTTTTTAKKPAATTTGGTDDVLAALGGLFATHRQQGYDAAKQEDAARIAELEQRIAELEQQVEAAKKSTPGTTINLTIDGAAHTHHTPAVLDPKFGMLAKLLASHENIYLYGPAGSGKNVLAEELAKALGVDFYYQNTILTKFDISGYKNAGGEFEETEFFKAWTKGGLFMLDEADNSQAEAVVALNAALANGYYTFPGVGRVKANEKFYCLAAGNTNAQGATEEYCGRYKWDESSRDRFFFVKIDYNKEVEKTIAGGHEDVLQFVRALRAAAAQLQIKVICGYRALGKLAKYHDDPDMSPVDLVSGYITRGMGRDDIHELVGLLEKDGLSGNVYFKALEEIEENS